MLPYESTLALGLTDLAMRLGVTGTNFQLTGSIGPLDPLTQRFDLLRRGGIDHLELAHVIRSLREGVNLPEAEVTDAFFRTEGRIWGGLSSHSSIPEAQRHQLSELVAGRGNIWAEGILEAHRWIRRPFLEGMLSPGALPKSHVNERPWEIKNTPLLRGDRLFQEFGRPIYIKAEGRQVTGSLKARGATYVLAAARLLGRQPERTRIVAPSLGNNAAGLLQAARVLGFANVEIILPAIVSQETECRLRRSGATIRRAGETLEQTEELTRYLFEDDPDVLYISPFDHPMFAMALGTIGVEIDIVMRRNNGFPEYSVIAPAGTGGLLAGLGTYLRGQDVSVYGVQAMAFSRLTRSFQAGSVVDEDAPSDSKRRYGMTLADNLAVQGVGPAIFKAIRGSVNGMAAVTEVAIQEGMLLMDGIGLVSEGAGALPAAAMISGSFESLMRPGPVVLVHTGENVEVDVLANVARRTRVSQTMPAVSLSSAHPTPMVPPPTFDKEGNPQFEDLPATLKPPELPKK